MRLTEILKPACVKVPLDAADKEHALYELVDLLAGQCDIADVQQLKDAVWQREQTRTTGIGHGIGIPHGKTAGLTELNMAIGLPASPIEFGAIDGKPVELIILLASPADQTGPHIQALAKISRLLTDDDFRNAIKKAESAEQLYDMLAQQEAAIAGA
ncbi:PTS sugar transporter subunit IIA [Phycisphaeraceae bacterium D3-23]